MEVDDRRTPDGELGRRVAAGRDATIHAIGNDRVLRRTPRLDDLRAEASLMEHLRAAGYPVPRVDRVGPGEMVLERIDGPTMLDDLAAHPWRVRRHARTLAELHTRLHALDAPDALRPHPLAGRSILHLDLHPGNVICSPTGPVVIDWTNARLGDPAADVALTWILVGAFHIGELPSTGGVARLVAQVEGVVTPWIRRQFLATFLPAAGPGAATRRALAAVAETRIADRNTSAEEADAIRALVRTEAALLPPESFGQ